jgi:hypothetical protein
MRKPRRPDIPRTYPAAGGGAWRPSPVLLAIAVVLVCGALAWWWTSAPPAADVGTAAPVVESGPAPAGPPAVGAASASAPALAVAAAPATTPPGRPTRDPDGDQTPDLADYVNPGERPTMPEVLDRLHQAGVHSGLGAFSPPGTRPPLVGLAVPEDFVLPDGYVRHYQATDDGQRIGAILMVAPGRQFFDAAGRPIAMPKDRVVPPELAPPGLSIERITIPAPIETGKPGS